MRAVVFAYHDVGCSSIRTLADLGVDVALVYTHDDDPAEDTWFGSVRATCDELGIPHDAAADPNDAAQVARIRALAPHALFSFYYRNILRDPVLACGERGAVNLHGSLLPRYRGRAPVNWMILHGEREGGVTLHDMIARPDAGDVIDREAFPIADDDRPADVYAKVVHAAGVVLRRSAFAVLDGTARRARQLESNATTFGRRRPDDGRIDFHLAAGDVRNLVRAVTRPYPGAFAFVGTRRVNVWWAEMARATADSDAAPGTLRHAAGGGVLVTCGDGRSLLLSDLDIDGCTVTGDDLRSALPEGASLASYAEGLSSHPEGNP